MKNWEKLRKKFIKMLIDCESSEDIFRFINIISMTKTKVDLKYFSKNKVEIK